MQLNDCPFCLPQTDRVIFVEPLIKGLWDGFPVNPGHILITPHRHVASWSELHVSEQAAVLEAIEKAKKLIRELHPADGFNVGFNDGSAAGQTIPHFHLHVIPRVVGDMPDPRGGVRHVIPTKGNYLAKPSARADPAPNLYTPHARSLIEGGEDGLIRHLLPHIDQSQAVDVAVSFVLESGIRMLRPHFQDLLSRDGRLRILTGDYLDVTDPDALRRMMDLEGRVELKVFESSKTGFHPKSWIFHLTDGAGIALVGSSNLSETALRTGVEWNFRSYTDKQSGDWRDVLDGFERLIARPEVRDLTHIWIDDYERRRIPKERRASLPIDVTQEPELAQPAPHAIQRKALACLEETRRNGFSSGLVVLATGLGKTWLGAFDANRSEFRKVLFVAHREEILNQAMETFRICRPKAKLGRFGGARKERDTEVLFASVQTLGKLANLRGFAPDEFDYLIVDEFHHAAAATYRRLIDYFTPKFMLGLTATPERMDGGDLLGLCQENLVFRCDAFEGIDAGLLSQFSYFGVPDEVDYAQIPWRANGFDETELTAAVATQARAQNALEQLQRHGGTKTLGFCVSQRHADFMADYFLSQGLRSVAVHAGKTSAPRASSLERLAQGELDIVFAVDMFNEGVDVPTIDSVLMLRPTESSVIWMQQFGRGLRRAVGKERLTVIDYIGNHRSFLTKVRALLQSGPGDRALALKFEELLAGISVMPAGCEITYELEAIDLIQSLLKPTARGDALESFYADFKMRFGQRPTALEVFHAGFNPRVSGHGSWFDFVRAQGDLSVTEVEAFPLVNDFLDTIAKAPMTKSYKMLVLKAMRIADQVPGRLSLGELTQRVIALAERNPVWRRDISAPLETPATVARLLKEQPLAAWSRTQSPAGRSYFASIDDGFAITLAFPVSHRGIFEDWTDEIVEWRLAEYLARDGAPSLKPDSTSSPAGATASREAELWREYAREDIPALFGLRFNTGAWNQGIVVQGRQVILLVTLEKGDLAKEHRFEDMFLSPSRFQWQSQNRTKQISTHGQIISGQLLGYTIHLFVRSAKKRGLKAAPFVYCGTPRFANWHSDAPITVNWKLDVPVPDYLRRTFKVP
jgi:superfamily II DNA or RNA helicase/HKD family nuclease/diadenosine tetraphosphate (Ap4A) HIT family hydrolase